MSIENFDEMLHRTVFLDQLWVAGGGVGVGERETETFRAVAVSFRIQ